MQRTGTKSAAWWQSDQTVYDSSGHFLFSTGYFCKIFICLFTHVFGFAIFREGHQAGTGGRRKDRTGLDFSRDSACRAPARSP